VRDTLLSQAVAAVSTSTDVPAGALIRFSPIFVASCAKTVADGIAAIAKTSAICSRRRIRPSPLPEEIIKIKV
jgi:hypothetical protein